MRWGDEHLLAMYGRPSEEAAAQVRARQGSERWNKTRSGRGHAASIHRSQDPACAKTPPHHHRAVPSSRAVRPQNQQRKQLHHQPPPSRIPASLNWRDIQTHVSGMTGYLQHHPYIVPSYTVMPVSPAVPLPGKTDASMHHSSSSLVILSRRSIGWRSGRITTK